MWRILTESKNVSEIEKILINSGVDFTHYSGTGSWMGVLEKSIIIELDGEISKFLIDNLAHKIGRLNQQEAVMIQYLPITTRLLHTKESNEFKYEKKA